MYIIFQKWADFVREVDPDLFTGYNINNFDFPYLINRSKHLNCKNFSFLGRIKNIRYSTILFFCKLVKDNTNFIIPFRQARQVRYYNIHLLFSETV